MFLFLVLGVLAGSSFVMTNAALTCDDAYRSRSSTLCENNSNKYQGGSMSQQDKVDVINAHNDYRAQTPGSNIIKAIWDENLGDMARAWARQCSSGHDTSDARYIIEYYTSSGQNAAWGSGARTWNNVVTAWYDELNSVPFRYGVSQFSDGVGHYTQVVLAGVSRIGCGYAQCSNGYYYVCNYIAAQMTSDITRPYKEGSSCGDCSNKCNGGLCDCGGTHCFNGGTLDLNTCTCACAGSIFSGDECLDKTCPPSEPESCNSNDDCEYYTSLKEECPFSCGICDESEAVPCEQHPSCHKSPEGCIYMGTQHSDAQCSGYGNNGQDKSSCGSHWDCNSCEQYSNIPTEYCPVMCGICPA